MIYSFLWKDRLGKTDVLSHQNVKVYKAFEIQGFLFKTHIGINDTACHQNADCKTMVKTKQY